MASSRFHVLVLDLGAFLTIWRGESLDFEEFWAPDVAACEVEVDVIVEGHVEYFFIFSIFVEGGVGGHGCYIAGAADERGGEREEGGEAHGCGWYERMISREKGRKMMEIDASQGNAIFTCPLRTVLSSQDFRCISLS